MKAPNNILEDFINKATYGYTIMRSNIDHSELKVNNNIEPLWICGLFRSGTSLVTNLVNQLGIDIGPEKDLLKPKGPLAQLNPNGFYENYLMMEWSLHIFSKLNSWGDQPPSIDLVKSFDLTKIDYREFVYDSIVNFHDDRISNKNKSRILQKYYPGNLNSYFSDHFNERFAIKNPHFLLLFPLLDNYWPQSKYLVVFRNPYETIESAKKVTPRATLELFYQYYSRIINHPNALFIDYNEMVLDPEKTIDILSEKLNLKNNSQELSKLINRSSNSISTIENLPQHILNIYQELQKKAINSTL